MDLRAPRAARSWPARTSRPPSALLSAALTKTRGTSTSAGCGKGARATSSGAAATSTQDNGQSTSDRPRRIARVTGSPPAPSAAATAVAAAATARETTTAATTARTARRRRPRRLSVRDRTSSDPSRRLRTLSRRPAAGGALASGKVGAPTTQQRSVRPRTPTRPVRAFARWSLSRLSIQVSHSASR